MNVPTEDDWRSEPWGIDTPYAYRNFHGKSFEEAVLLFERGEIAYLEDLMVMPSRVFGYYLRPYITYLMSDAAKDDSDGASCFITVVAHRVKHQLDDVRPLWTQIEPVLKKLAEAQEYFDADWLIYGSFRSLIRQIVERGFPVSFEVDVPEVVPASVTISQMAFSQRPVSLAVAAQVFANSGVPEITATSSIDDVLKALGSPSDAGGGEHPRFGHIPFWIRYNRRDAIIRFAYDGNVITGVTFMPPNAVDM